MIIIVRIIIRGCYDNDEFLSHRVCDGLIQHLKKRSQLALTLLALCRSPPQLLLLAPLALFRICSICLSRTHTAVDAIAIAHRKLRVSLSRQTENVCVCCFVHSFACSQVATCKSQRDQTDRRREREREDYERDLSVYLIKG